jgi:UDP-N-acetylmuramoyl-tripeptide--D-alanyl-D-alanine ligase
LHVGLKDAIDAAGVDLVFAVGANMLALFEVIEPDRRGRWTERSDGLRGVLLEEVEAGDAVMIKGSLGSRMAPLVAALVRHFSERAAGSV